MADDCYTIAYHGSKNTEDYRKNVDRIREKYDGRIKAVLARMRHMIQNQNLETTDIYLETDSCYRWSFCIKPGANENDWIDFTLELSDSLEYNGTLDGVNFSIHITTFEGKIICECIDYVWVANATDVEERFQIIENLDEKFFADLVLEYLKRS